MLDLDPGLRSAVTGLESAFLDYHAGRRGLPEGDERIRVVYPPGYKHRPYPKDMRILPAMVPAVGAAGLRLGCVATDAHGGTTMTILMDFETLRLQALIEDHLLHGVRSGAPTGIAVNRFARPGPCRVGMIGTGRISAVQLTVTCGARSITGVKPSAAGPSLAKPSPAITQRSSAWRFGQSKWPYDTAVQHGIGEIAWTR